MPDENLVLRSDDPRRSDLEARGFTVVGESWGARLVLGDPPDLTVCRRAVARAQSAGLRILELTAESAADLHELERANHEDYPVTPATAHAVLDAAATVALWTGGTRVFGAFDQHRLLGATAISLQDGRAETEFTSVLRDHRGRGIGAAVKAASVIALAETGTRVFGTGGAAVNDASLGVNRALGYRITERWFSYGPPTPV